MSKRKKVSPKVGSFADLGGQTNLSGKYYGQLLPIGKEQNDLYSKLLQLGSGLKDYGSGVGSGLGSSSKDAVGGSGSQGSGAFPTAMGSALHSMFGDNASYADLIKGSYGNSDLIKLLKSLGINFDKEMDASQTNDWNKQLLNIILQQYVNQEQRSYDRSVLNEQRLYDNPQNALARLMGAGISRDAAIQMLSGSSGSGSSSGLIGSMGGDIDTGIPASESALNNIQGKTGIANTVFAGFNALSSLVGLGFSVPQAIQQTRFLQNQNALTSRQLSAYDSAGRAYSILNAAGAASDAFGSVGSAAAAIAQLAKSGNTDAAQFVASGGLSAMTENAPFASQTISDLYRSERSSSDYAQQFTAELANAYADIDLKKANKDNLTAQIDLYAAEIDEIHASEDYTRGLTNLLQYQAKLMGKQMSFIDAQTKAQRLANNYENSFQNAELQDEDGNSFTGLEWNTKQRLNHLYIDVHGLIAQKDKKLWNEQVNTMLKNEQNLQAMYDLSIMYSKGTLSYVKNEMDEKSKDLLWFCNACEESGVFDYVRTKSGAETAGNLHFDKFSSSMPAAVTDEMKDFFGERGKKKKRWWNR